MNMPLPLAPGFSRVKGRAEDRSRFSGFHRVPTETVETVSLPPGQPTRLKPGANESRGRYRSDPEP